MASFVSVKVYNELVKRVEDLEAQVRALESYGEPEPEAEAEIPSIEEAVEEPGPHEVEDEILDIEDAVEEENPADPLTVQFGDKIADLLKENGYGSPAAVGKAVQDGVDLTAIPGVGAATFKVIKEALEIG